MRGAMASADGGEQETMAQPDGPQEADGDQQMPQNEFHLCPPHGGQQEGSGNELAVPDDEDMPESFTTGTQKAFKWNTAFSYERVIICGEIMYLCSRGSDWSRPDEYLILRREGKDWIAYDSGTIQQGETPVCRSPVFRSRGRNITQPGLHEWEINHCASPSDNGLMQEWHRGLMQVTRHGMAQYG